MYQNLDNYDKIPDMLGKQELLNFLKNIDYSITSKQIYEGKLDGLYNNGLLVIAGCWDGTGRCYNVAKTLSEQYSIPSIRLIGGLKQYKEDPEAGCYLSTVQYRISEAPKKVVAVITLTDEEFSKHANLVSGFRARRYTSSARAIDAISNMDF